ncbi:MAG: hypothetical protein HY555_01615 [Euryarchaeota archaeon]|nr:hypothetical protein [Euryarchaeota archaeon]
MGLDLLRKIFGKREAEAEALVLEWRGLEGFLGGRMEALKEEAYKDLLPVADEIPAQREKALEVLEELEVHELPDEIKGRVYRPVLTAKPLYLKGMRDALGRMGPRPRDFPDLLAFQNSVMASMKTVQIVQLGHGRLVASVFQEEILRLGTVLNRILDASRELKDGTNERVEALKKLELLREKARRFAEVKASAERLGAEKEGLGAKAAGLEVEVERLGEELSRLLDGMGAERQKGLEAELEVCRKDLEGARAKAVSMVSPLRRALKKYKRLLDGKGAEEALVEGLVEEPASLLGADGKELLPILDGLEASIGGLDLDPRDREKALPRIAVLRSALPGLLTEFSALREKERALGAEIDASPFLMERAVLEARLRDAKETMAAVQQELDRREVESETLGKELETLMRVLGEGLSGLEGKEVKIT